MNDLVKSMPDNPVIVLTDEKKYSEFYERIAEEVRAHVPDVSTAAGRGEIKSLAYKVTRTKTAIDEAGKKLNEEAREKINAVDVQRRKIRKELDELADEIRKPVTDWEAAEDARKEKADATLFAIIKATVDASEARAIGDTKRSDILRDIRVALAAIDVDPEIMRDRIGEAISTKADALMKIGYQIIDAMKEEADAEELARLRAEKAERDAREAEERAERIAKEAAAKEEADRIERERIETEERAERERRQRQEEIDAARREEVRKAEEAIAAADAKRKAEREEELRAAQAAIDAAKAEADARVAEAERRQREQEAAIAEAKAREDRERIEAQRREKDRQHRGVILKAAKEAIMVHGGVDEPTAKKIVLAIGANEIPNVRIEF